MAQARNTAINLSEAYKGGDQFMREVMRVAHEFELWASAHVNFDEFDEVWPYFLHDHFGPTCVTVIPATSLDTFDHEDCFRIALRLCIPLRTDRGLPIPICAESANPIPGSAFWAFRIQTVRDSVAGKVTSAFTSQDDPFDEEFGPIYSSLYGVRGDGSLEHITSRPTYHQILAFATALVPAVRFIVTPPRKMKHARRSDRTN